MSFRNSLTVEKIECLYNYDVCLRNLKHRVPPLHFRRAIVPIQNALFPRGIAFQVLQVFLWPSVTKRFWKFHLLSQVFEWCDNYSTTINPSGNFVKFTLSLNNTFHVDSIVNPHSLSVDMCHCLTVNTSPRPIIDTHCYYVVDACWGIVQRKLVRRNVSRK